MVGRSVCALALVASLGGTARAETATESVPAAATSVPSAPPTSRWYGGPTLAIDLAAAGTAGLGVALFYAVSERGDHPLWPLAITAVPAYAALLFGGPIVHWVHGHIAKGFGSLALRLFLPVIGSVLDIALLSREPMPARPPVTLLPFVTTDGRGFTAGAALAF